MTGSCRDDTVYIDIHSLHSQVLKDVDTQCESLLSAQFSLSKVRVPRKSKLSEFASHE